ncbi:MAG TPA: class I SAM-dependent methyltransferase [Gemmataceae bacterium]|jgi:SAM-dependent methyltransferase|nr:class I SAM-dependent methyltransferase [Gemmataceae bacterium]
MQPVQIKRLATRQDVESLLQIPGLEEFVRESYRCILLRDPEPSAIRARIRRLRLRPFYTRRQFLQRLLSSDEFRNLLHAQCARLDEHRQALNQQQLDLNKAHDEQCRKRMEFDLQKVLQAKMEGQKEMERQEWQELENIVLSQYGELMRRDSVEAFIRDSYQAIIGRPPTDEEFTSGCARLRSGINRMRRDFLRRLLAHRAPQQRSTQPAFQPNTRLIYELFDSGDNQPASCRICQAPMIYKWSGKVLAEKYTADYYECTACKTLQIPHPYWLDEAYASEDAAQAFNPDGGRFMRNYSAFRYISALHQAEVFPPHPLLLDFAGGYGLLTQMLYDGGFNAYQTDPFVPVPFFASNRCISDLERIPSGTFDAVTALEVFEHLTNPHETVARLARILKPAGTLVLSTGLYESGVHDARWPYLAKLGGQHVTFWSQPALSYIAGRYRFKSVGYFPRGGGFLILFSRLDPDVLKTKLGQATVCLEDMKHLAQSVSAWDLLPYLEAAISKEGLVDATGVGDDDVSSQLKIAA